ncbi:MAG: tetratricopeptide repeat protein [Candidatus Cyclobacteriaceae bacterium M3_2C_046]
MKRLIFVFILFATISFSGCALKQMLKMADQQQLTVTPSPLEVHADTVQFEVSAVLPAKMLRKNFIYAIDPKYEYNGQSVDLERIEFDATNYSSDEQPRKSETFSFPYDEAMGNGNLVIQGVAISPSNGKELTTDEMPIAEGLITTSKLVKDAYFAAYAPHGYNTGEELEPTVISFYFNQGSSYLRPSERRSDRGDNFQAFIAEKNVTRTVTITGTHSPEGPERVNENLAEERASAIEEWYRNMMDRYDYQDAADEIEFILKPVVEDWTMFKEQMEEYDGITSSEKQEYLQIINGSGSFEEKEDQLHQLPTYNKVFRDLYPELRRARTEILTVKEKKSEAEISVLSKQVAEGSVDADTLNELEMAYGATLTPSLDEKEDIYDALVDKSDSYVAHNNLGAVYLERAIEANSESQINNYLEQATTQFEIANRKEENAASFINLAVVNMMQGNVMQAQEAISQAEDLNPSSENLRGLNAVKGTVEIMRAEYTQAIQDLTNAEETADNLFNLGLAYLLNNDPQNAMTAFEEASEQDNDAALAYYGRAIAAARMNNESAVFDNLERAVSLEPELKERALNDLEFRQLAGTDQFRQAIR